MNALVLAFALMDEPADRAFALLGDWSCVSAAGSHGTLSYAFTDAEQITLINAFTTADGSTGEFDDTFRFDVTRGTWYWSSDFTAANPIAVSETGTAPPWTGDTWTFEGTETTRRMRVGPPAFEQPVRMVYRLSKPATLERSFEHQINGVWTPYSRSVCTPLHDDE